MLPAPRSAVRDRRRVSPTGRLRDLTSSGDHATWPPVSRSAHAERDRDVREPKSRCRRKFSPMEPDTGADRT